ncbi:MAG: NlpC/P60 family protein [Verrucomicrobia bacterium]|nr:NlpC/P60 family protein [Verrucomicrobiota bacterium]MDA1006329.1 NlpC/P60 family protein [Verrucomicrobiota bacterium]
MPSPLPLLFLSFLCHSMLTADETKRPPPGRLSLVALEENRGLDPQRLRLVAIALQTVQRFNFNRYLYGSADPSKKAFDCSGAIYYLLRLVDLQPPRSSSAQYDWIRKAGNLVLVPKDTTSIDAAIFDKLNPGDLIFWSGTYKPRDGRTNGVTHVQMYIGRERKDALRVMVGSSDGRSYRGTARCGFGIFDLKLPRAGSKARLVAFGTPPGLIKP